MDLRFSAEENAFRDKLRTFFRSKVPASIRAKVMEGRHLDKEDWVASHKVLHAEGLAVPHWPKQWGGSDWTPVQHYIYAEELQYNGVPQPLPFNVSMCGPVIIAFGTEEQKKRFLPRMASLDDWWCQGFSEPGAGSDLAGLTTTAVRKGDHYVVNGQKTWTTLAAICRLDLLPRPHRSNRQEATRHLLPADRHEDPGPERAADPDAGWRTRGQRGVLR
jgi:alkylation response protein AidB-like acyl-CoA dehydrogenase